MAMQSPKKMALMHLIKNMNSRRFQDKPVDPTDEMHKTMASMGDDDEQEEEPSDEHDEMMSHMEPSQDDEFDDYKKSFMKGNRPSSPKGPTLAIMIGQKSPGGVGARPPMKGRTKRG